MIVLDTHALLWWAADPDRLSPVAAARLRDVERHGGFASAISIWELGLKIKRSKLDVVITIDELVRRTLGTAIELLPVDTATWVRSLDLPWEHRDPADRVIVATALLRGVPLMTNDAEIHRFGGVECVW